MTSRYLVIWHAICVAWNPFYLSAIEIFSMATVLQTHGQFLCVKV